MLPFWAHSNNADSYKAKETLKNENEEDSKEAWQLFKVRTSPELSKCLGGKVGKKGVSEKNKKALVYSHQ